MEAVGARLGRSSSRYGTTAVFSGPVRKWTKQWVPITPPSSSSSPSNHSSINGSSFNASNGGTLSRLHLFKWTPLSTKLNNEDSNSSSIPPKNHLSNSDDSEFTPSTLHDAVFYHPPRKKIKYIPIAVLENQTKDTEEISDDEARLADTDGNPKAKASERGGHDVKPDINDLPLEDNGENEENRGETIRDRQDLNEIDLSLGLTSHEDGYGSDTRSDPTEDDT